MTEEEKEEFDKYAVPPGKNATYQAANGHMFETVEWTRSGERVQWNAQHSDSCPCNGEEPIPDW